VLAGAPLLYQPTPAQIGRRPGSRLHHAARSHTVTEPASPSEAKRDRLLRKLCLEGVCPEIVPDLIGPGCRIVSDSQCASLKKKISKSLLCRTQRQVSSHHAVALDGSMSSPGSPALQVGHVEVGAGLAWIPDRNLGCPHAQSQNEVDRIDRVCREDKAPPNPCCMRGMGAP
jgi:hypothetical protein